MNNCNNTSPITTATTKRRKCTWSWPPCEKWMQNNPNQLCTRHNKQFENGERPRDPTTVANANTDAIVHTTTTTTTPVDATTTANTKKKKEKKKVHKGRRALMKKNKISFKEQLRELRTADRKGKAKKEHKGNNAARKKRGKIQDVYDDNDTSTEGRKKRKRRKKSQKKIAKQQSTKKAARSSSPSSSSSSAAASESPSSSSASSSSPSSSSSSSSSKSNSSLSSEDESETEFCKKKGGKTKDKSKDEHEPEEEAQNQRAVLTQVLGQLEANGIYTHLNLMEQRFHDQFIQLNNQVNQMINRQDLMQDRIDYMISQQAQKDHDNYSPQLHSNDNVSQTNPPAKSTERTKVAKSNPLAKSRSKRKKSKVEDKRPQLHSDSSVAQSKHPAKSPENEHTQVAPNSDMSAEQSNPPAKSPDNEPTKVAQSKTPYYKDFAERKRGEPPRVNVGAFAGIENKNVYCYSNAILQCLASCMVLSDFSPSETHAEFALNHAFASLMNSMVESERSVDPSAFMTIFMPLFRPPKEIEQEVDADEQEGMYYDFV